jgi:hypothetical protein
MKFAFALALLFVSQQVLAQEPQPAPAVDANQPAAEAKAATPDAGPPMLTSLIELKKEWPTLSNEDFAKSGRKAGKMGMSRALRKSLSQALGRESQKRLLNSDAIEKDDYYTLNALVVWGLPYLTASQKAALGERARARSSAESIVTFPLVDLQRRKRLLSDLGLGELGKKEITQWLDGRELVDIQTSDLEWLCFEASETDTSKHRWLEVKWEGFVQAPKTGSYTFSPGDLRIESKIPKATSLTTMKVWIDDVLVMDTHPTEGPQSKPVELKAESPSAVRVEFHHRHYGPEMNARYPALARLFWEGPGIARQLVPSENLLPPEASRKKNPNGLSAEYACLPAEGVGTIPNKSYSIDPQIDFWWTTANSFGSRHMKQGSPLHTVVEELVTRYTQPEYLKEFSESFYTKEVDLSAWRRMAELMTPKQRATVLNAARETDSFMNGGSTFVLRTTEIFRGGAEDEAFKLLGQWCHHRSSVRALPIAWLWVSSTRNSAWLPIGELIAMENPEGPGIVEENYLQFADGRCCEWTATALSYAYALQGKLDTWIEKLDARLADPSLKGDNRVYWLLARAHAEEVRSGGPVAPYVLGNEQPTAGFKFLDEAGLAAETEAVYLRVAEEQLSRLASVENKEQAAAFLVELQDRYTSPEAKAEFAYWQGRMQQSADGAANRRNYKLAVALKELADLMPKAPAVESQDAEAKLDSAKATDARAKVE